MTEHDFSKKQKNSCPVPQMTYFVRLSFCSGGSFKGKDGKKVYFYENLV